MFERINWIDSIKDRTILFIRLIHNLYEKTF